MGANKGDVQGFEEGHGGTVVGGSAQDHDVVHGDTDRVPGGDGVCEGIADRCFVPRRYSAPGASTVCIGKDGHREEGVYGHP